tara:strand:+ start:30 stop:302 length:273 start_codon:yes stop_codon:yes gene_type:complete
MRVQKSSRDGKKYMLEYDGKIIHFGQEGASDYTINKDPKRKASYISRHQKNENWTKSGANTAGFWSRWLLWNEPISVAGNMKLVHKKFNI